MKHQNVLASELLNATSLYKHCWWSFWLFSQQFHFDFKHPLLSSGSVVLLIYNRLSKLLSKRFHCLHDRFLSWCSSGNWIVQMHPSFATCLLQSAWIAFWEKPVQMHDWHELCLIWTYQNPFLFQKWALGNLWHAFKMVHRNTVSRYQVLILQVDSSRLLLDQDRGF